MGAQTEIDGIGIECRCLVQKRSDDNAGRIGYIHQHPLSDLRVRQYSATIIVYDPHGGLVFGRLRSSIAFNVHCSTRSPQKALWSRLFGFPSLIVAIKSSTFLR